MSSEQNNSTSFPPTEPELCDNGCGFSRTSNMNICSKCYRSLQAEEDQTAVAKAAVKNSLKLPSCSLIITPEQKQPLETKPASVFVISEPSSAPIAMGQEESEPSKPARTNRCCSWNKKVGVMEFKCKCGSTFCGSHRYPEKHECSFDFKEVGRDTIAKANPVIKADKDMKEKNKPFLFIK
ncbi:hypothetical protein Bca52824_023618 [Brassica carinata]|uniref:AN1-type domain-containing protein n=1 Tax=Brassica carinata TaxID=52824 RepID=A0A8X7VIU0_BRACI|nr:hypothetical protein Bca52824_023618 [Brassica carinata]